MPGGHTDGLATEMDTMKFFYSPGTSSRLVHIVLRESGLVFESIRVDEHTKAMDDFARMNAGTISPQEFFSPQNVSAIQDAA